jgi:hypothetical protein
MSDASTPCHGRPRQATHVLWCREPRSRGWLAPRPPPGAGSASAWGRISAGNDTEWNAAPTPTFFSQTVARHGGRP